jgi:type I restriction enzyme S subunit
LLDRYRQSVLAAAFRGDLTADWRALHPDTEPASELLTRIREEHRCCWEARTRRGGYKGLSGAEPQKSDNLPASWRVVTGAHLFQWGSGKNLPSKHFQEGIVPVYGGNGISGYHSGALIDHPTIVIGRGALCGNVYSSKGRCWVTDNAIYASHVPSFINLDFIRTAFQSSNLNMVAAGSGQPFVNQAILNATKLPLPPLAEQDLPSISGHLRFDWGC